MIGTLGLALAFASCSDKSSPLDPNGGPDPDPPELNPELGLTRVTMPVSVELPSGAGVSAEQLRVLSALGKRTDLDGSGEATVTVFDGGPQVALVVAPSGEPVLAGWLNPSNGRTIISARTTAEVLAYFDIGAYVLLDPLRTYMVEALAASGELAELESAVASALTTAPYHLTGAATALGAVRQSVAKTLLADVDVASASADGLRRKDDDPDEPPIAAAVLVDPSDELSGSRVIQQGMWDVVVRNSYRIRRLAYVDRIDPPTGEIAKIDISPTTGATSLVDAISDIITETTVSAIYEVNNTAYAPVASDPIRLPMEPEEADRTDYRITVVGPGLFAGAVGELSSARRQELNRLIAKSLIQDFLIPLIVDGLLPLKGDELDAFFKHTAGETVLNTFITTLTQTAPQIFELAYEGDMGGALWEALTALTTDGTFQTIVLQFVLDLVYDKFGDDAQFHFAEYAKKITDLLGAVDQVLTLFDSAVQAAQLSMSARAEVFDVTVIPSNVNLLPPQSSIQKGQEVSLSAHVPDASGDDASPMEYRWWTSGAHGDLRDAVGHVGTEFTSSRSEVVYVSNGTSEGYDQVLVEVYEIAGSDRIRVGVSDTATIRVIDVAVDIIPASGMVMREGTIEFVARVEPPQEEELYYRWITPGNHGTTFPASGALTFRWIEYTANSDATIGGKDPIEVEVFIDPNEPPIGTATAEVTIEEMVVHGGWFIRTNHVQDSQGNARHCTAALLWFPLVDGATGYRVHAYGFHHPNGWGNPSQIRLNLTEPLGVHDVPGCATWGWGGVEGDRYIYRMSHSSGPIASLDNVLAAYERLYGGLKADVSVRF